MPGPFLRSCLSACLLLAASLVPAAARAQAEPAPGPSFDLEIRAPAPAKDLLERHLDLRRYREVPDLDEAELARLAMLAERDARELLGTLGYFTPTVTIRREAGTRPRLVVEVALGEKTVVGAVDIGFDGAIATATDADTVRQREGIRSGWGLPTGQGFTQGGWDDAKAQALRRLAAKRFLAGRISESLADVDAATHRVGLGLKLDSGPVFRLGQQQVTGVERYDPRLVPRFARLAPGSEYDRDQLVQAQLRLTGSGYYDSAFIFVDPEADPAAVPVQITVREAKLQKVVLGAGITTDAGPRLSLEHTHNRVPGIGWRATTSLQLDRKVPYLQSEWTAIPDESGWRWSVLGRAERLEDGDLVTQGRRLRFGRFRSQDHIDRNVYLQYDSASVTSATGLPLSSAESGAGSALSMNYVWTGRYFDSLPTASSGFGVGVELGGGLTLGSDRAPFQRTLVRWLWLRPLTRGRLQLRAEGGAVLARPSAQLPATQLFRTGGDTTVRGYGFRDIGVALPNGDVGPGRYLAVGSVEWQRPIRRGGVDSEFDSLLFVDAGAVANRVSELRAVVGVGTGVRWRSPIGPVQGAIAYGLKPRKLRLHLSVGFQF
ncbi:autotransporter assembly complex family protein [Caenimonas terrae]|uniref:Autotransporter assembly complex family protein n=1 Tax=Caenimonas terrae TaxID=696074 RepID=A0ABW0NDE0_9BURK